MKTAIYIEDGIVQLVITPENDFEKNALTSFESRPLEAKIFAGSFYDCRGGWVSQSNYYPPTYGSGSTDRSIILKIAETKPPTTISQSAQRFKGRYSKDKGCAKCLEEKEGEVIEAVWICPHCGSEWLGT